MIVSSFVSFVTERYGHLCAWLECKQGRIGVHAVANLDIMNCVSAMSFSLHNLPDCTVDIKYNAPCIGGLAAALGEDYCIVQKNMEKGLVWDLGSKNGLLSLLLGRDRRRLGHRSAYNCGLKCSEQGITCAGGVSGNGRRYEYWKLTVRWQARSPTGTEIWGSEGTCNVGEIMRW